MKEKLKLLAGITDDDVANLYIELATQSVLDYTNRCKLIPSMQMLVVELASFYFSTFQRNGISGRGEGAISESYESSLEIPERIRKRLDAYRLLHASKRE